MTPSDDVNSRLDVPAITIRHVIRGEATKALTDPAVLVVCIAALIVNTALFALTAADLVRLSAGDGLVKLSDVGALMLAPVYLFLIIPVHVAGSEYVSGQLRLTLAAVPNRARLLIAKVAALAAVIIPAAVIALLPGRLFVTVTDGLPVGAILLDVTRWTAAYALLSCVAYGLAILLRSRITPVALLALIPLLLATGVFPWPAVIRLLPDQLGLSLLGTPGFEVTALPPTTAAALLTVWAAALLGAQAVAVLLRDS